MFTWNLMFVSQKRLEDTLSQRMVGDGEDKDVLVRIHTAIHTAEEAVDLAAFVKRLIPNARILGTSTSAIISGGKLIHDQCLISITQMDEGGVRAARIPTVAADGSAIPAEALCDRTAEQLVGNDTKLLFAFAPERYRDIERFVTVSNARMPGVQMAGGVVDQNDIIGDAGFVFDENGWSGDEMTGATASSRSTESRRRRSSTRASARRSAPGRRSASTFRWPTASTIWTCPSPTAISGTRGWASTTMSPRAG